MLLILLLLQLPLSSNGLSAESESLLNDNAAFNNLKEILGSNITDDVFFTHDFLSDIARYNFSVNEYAETCTDAYRELRPSPSEVLILRELPEFSRYQRELNITDQSHWIFSKTFEIIWSDSTERTAAIDRFTAKSRPETKKFANEIDIFLVDSFKRLISSQNETEKKVKIRVFDSYYAVLEAVQKFGHKYNAFTPLVKRDIENSFCLKNVLRWWNTESTGAFNTLFEIIMPEEIGVDVDGIEKYNEFLQDAVRYEIEREFYKRAAILNMPPQEYVDICTNNFVDMNSIGLEPTSIANMSTREFLGKEWGNQIHNFSSELLEVLQKENATFIHLVISYWNFLKVQRVEPGYNEHFFKKVESILIESLLELNNLAYSTRDEPEFTAPEFTMFRRNLHKKHQRYQPNPIVDKALVEFEQRFCFQFTLELMFQKRTFCDYYPIIFAPWLRILTGLCEDSNGVVEPDDDSNIFDVELQQYIQL